MGVVGPIPVWSVGMTPPGAGSVVTAEHHEEDVDIGRVH
jgi:hypothetical protein